MIERLNSITHRIGLMLFGVAAVVFLVMGYVISVSVKHHFYEQDNMALEGKLELIQNILMEQANDRADALSTKLGDALVGHHELAVMIASDQGKILFRNEHADFLAPRLTEAVSYQHHTSLKLREMRDGHHSYRGAVVTLTPPNTQNVYTIAIATNIAHHDDFLNVFEYQLITVGSAGLLSMTVLGWWATRRGLQPLRDMTQVVEGISAQHLDDRLELRRLPRELRSLALSFNRMLERLGDSLHRLTDFSSDIAHEFRTPINNLLTQTQVSLSKPRSADDYREILYSNLEEYERLARMIADMLFLAKADNGLVVPHPERFHLRQEMLELFEFYDALAAEKKLQLIVRGNADIFGDRLMIRRALSNLLSNAIRHSASGTTIEVNIASGAHAIELAVFNQGDLIAPEHLPRLFDRFYRTDASRRRVDEGAGLGLAITRSIVHAHGGDVTATSTAGKTQFIIRLPLEKLPAEK